MNAAQLQAWIAILDAAEIIGAHAVALWKAFAGAALSPEDNAAVLAQWQDNAARSARNAGLSQP